MASSVPHWQVRHVVKERATGGWQYDISRCADPQLAGLRLGAVLFNSSAQEPAQIGIQFTARGRLSRSLSYDSFIRFLCTSIVSEQRKLSTRRVWFVTSDRTTDFYRIPEHSRVLLRHPEKVPQLWEQAAASSVMTTVYDIQSDSVPPPRFMRGSSKEIVVKSIYTLVVFNIFTGTF
ncbi:hypothetical protein J6590_067309 [Homalodisca vitripennis]|nr:hypothetical protein J6590_067309 [Homalodisca vitripennis]